MLVAYYVCIDSLHISSYSPNVRFSMSFVVLIQKIEFFNYNNLEISCTSIDSTANFHDSRCHLKVIYINGKKIKMNKPVIELLFQ